MRLTFFNENSKERLWDIDTPKIKNTGHQMINYIKKQNKLRGQKKLQKEDLPETTPVKIALREALRSSKKTTGRPKTT